LGDRHTSSCPNQISIIAHGGLDVCDGEHRWFVMKKGQASDCRSGNARGILRLETRDTRGSLAARSESPIVLSDLRPTLREKHAKDGAPPTWGTPYMVVPAEGAPAPCREKLLVGPVFLWCSSYVHRRNGGMFCTMNRAVHRRRPDQLRRIGDEIETVLIFGKRLAFLVFDAAIYYVGLWSLVKWLLR